MDAHNDTLAEISIFRQLPKHDRLILADFCQLQRFDPLEQIIAQNMRSRNVYFIISGKVKVAYQTNSGREIAIRNHAKGDVFGVLSLINGNYRSARATALTSVMLLAMRREKFRKILLTYPKVSYCLNLHLFDSLYLLYERVLEFDVLDVNSRIHAELLRIAAETGSKNNVTTIDQMPTHAEIASRISTHREAITRELKNLESKGLIERKGKQLKILKMDSLRNMVARKFIHS